MSTSADLLRDSYQSLEAAFAEPKASDRRRSHAHHAATQASDVVMRPESTDSQREQAGYYLNQALILQAEFDPPNRLGSLVQQRIKERELTQKTNVPSVVDDIANQSRTGRPHTGAHPDLHQSAPQRGQSR